MRIRLSLIALILLSITVLAERTRLKPAINTNPQEDVKVGKEVAAQAEKEFTLISDRDVNTYVSNLGQRLVGKAPNESKFPFTFKVVDEKSINAFALPGGPIYIHRGAIESADNEAQIAGVIGHEIGHVILRHGMAQASKGQLLGGIAGALGGLLGGSKGGQIAAMAGTFGLNSVLLKYSRDAETQSDIMATQILYDSNYPPRAMAEFFDKLAKEHKGSSIEQFFSNHPIPENRIQKVNDEIRKIGPEPTNTRADTPEFQRAKRTLLAMPAPKPKTAANNSSSSKPTAPPQAPSTRMITFKAANLQLQHPENWKTAVNGTNIAIAPAGAADDRGNLGYGIIIDVFKPQNARSLDEATTQLLDSLRQSNPNIKVVRSRVSTRVDSRPAQLTELNNDSPFGGLETDVVITTFRSTSEMQYFIWVAPTKAMPQYQQAFQSIMNSVRMN